MSGEEVKITFADVAGAEEAKEEIQEVGNSKNLEKLQIEPRYQRGIAV